jgi:hypothetical protein
MALEFYKRLPRDMQDKDRLEKIRRQIEIYRQNYNSYLQKGIKTYLIAAESFSAVNAANSEKEAIAYEKIAVILENLAKEKQ